MKDHLMGAGVAVGIVVTLATIGLVAAGIGADHTPTSSYIEGSCLRNNSPWQLDGVVVCIGAPGANDARQLLEYKYFYDQLMFQAATQSTSKPQDPQILQ